MFSRIILIIMLLFVSPSVNKTIHIIFVEPVGESFSLEEQDTATLFTARAVTYWHTLSPVLTTLTLDPNTQLITTTEDVLLTPGILENGRIDDSAIYVYVIDNSVSNRYINNDSNEGLADPWSIWITTNTLEAVYAHELGHALYNLPHQILAPVDIMNFSPQVAYQRNTIGCDSLRELGKPCYQVAIPIINR